MLRGRTQGSLCKRRGRPWRQFARRLHGVLGDVTASSPRRQRSGKAVKARRMRCERRGRAVKAP